MKTKDKVRYWLTQYEHLRDNDYKLCCNIWNQELKEFIIMDNSTARDFLRIYALGKLTSAPSIKRARAKLQELHIHLRGDAYNKRHKIQKDTLFDLDTMGAENTGTSY